MNKLFNPGIKLMHSLKCLQKFTLIGLIFIFLITGIIYLLFTGVNRWIDFAKKEKLGLDYIIPITRLMKNVQEERGMMNAYLNGDVSFRQKLINNQTEINREINIVNAIDNKIGKDLKTTKEWNKIKNELQGLQKKLFKLTPQQSFTLHTNSINDMLILLENIGHSSNLELDPGTDTHHFINPIIRRMPLMIENMAKIRGLSSGIAQKKVISFEERREITGDLALIKSLDAAIKRDLNIAFTENPSLKTKINPYLQNSNRQIYKFINIIEREILYSKKITIKPEAIFTKTTQMINPNYEFLEVQSSILEKLLQKRIDNYYHKKHLVYLFTFTTLTLIVYLFIAFYFSTLNAITRLRDTSKLIAEGNLSARTCLTTKDEINELAVSLNSMTESLQKLFRREQLLRATFIGAKNFESHDDTYNFLLNKLVNELDIEAASHLHYTDDGNLFVCDEIIKNNEIETTKNNVIFLENNIRKFLSAAAKQVITVNDVDEEIKDAGLKGYLLSKNIKSFLIYSTSKQFPEKVEEMILGLTMVCSNTPKKWQPDEINFFKLLVDAISLLYLEIVQRKETERIRESFTATLTHDLKSPIMAEQKALEFILSRKPDTHLELFSEYLQDIYKTNEELLRIVRNLLAVYHYESGKVDLNITDCNIKDIINEIVKSLSPLALDMDSKISVYVKENLPHVMADKLEISRVLTNLVNNAIKHTKKGTQITISANKAGDYACISIADNGSGIPESEKNNIFQRYPTAKRKVGTGLGLYLSKQIVEAHKGKIWFKSEEGVGTTFFFTLPLKK